jgi:hypothetical protein
MDNTDKKKLGKRGLKRATRSVDQLIEEHCHVKQTPWIIMLFMTAAAYAMHVQRKFSALPEMDKQRMVTIGKKIEKRARVKGLSRKQEGGIEHG